MRNARPQYAFTSLDVRGPLNVDSTLYVSSTISCVEGMKVGGDLDVDGNATVVGVITGSVSGNATTADTVTTAAQPAITSVGTLTGLTSSGQIDCTLATTSTSTTTGAIITAGGMGIAKAVFIGQGINAAGNADFGGDFYIAGIFQSTDVTPSTSSTTGSTLIAGGIGVALDSFFGGLIATTSDTIRIATQKTPASATATGTKGDIVHDTNYIYVCTATDTWTRTAISTW